MDGWKIKLVTSGKKGAYTFGEGINGETRTILWAAVALWGIPCPINKANGHWTDQIITTHHTEKRKVDGEREPVRGDWDHTRCISSFMSWSR